MCRNFHCFIALHTAPLACTVPTTIDDLSQHISGALWDIWCLFTEIKYIKRAASVSQLPLQRSIALPLIERMLHVTTLHFPFGFGACMRECCPANRVCGHKHVCSTHICDCLYVQRFTLDKQISVIEKRRHKAMNKYCRDAVAMGIDKDAAQKAALKAQSEPHDDPRLKRIYRDHQDLVAKQSQMAKLDIVIHSE